MLAPEDCQNNRERKCWDEMRRHKCGSSIYNRPGDKLKVLWFYHCPCQGSCNHGSVCLAWVKTIFLCWIKYYYIIHSHTSFWEWDRCSSSLVVQLSDDFPILFKGTLLIRGVFTAMFGTFSHLPAVSFPHLSLEWIYSFQDRKIKDNWLLFPALLPSPFLSYHSRLLCDNVNKDSRSLCSGIPFFLPWVALIYKVE
jgi:hypothetical protein